LLPDRGFWCLQNPMIVARRAILTQCQTWTTASKAQVEVMCDHHKTYSGGFTTGKCLIDGSEAVSVFMCTTSTEEAFSISTENQGGSRHVTVNIWVPKQGSLWTLVQALGRRYNVPGAKGHIGGYRSRCRPIFTRHEKSMSATI